MQFITSSGERHQASGGRQPSEAIRVQSYAVVAALLALSLVGCIDSRVAKLYGGEEVLTALQSATKIEALRLDPQKYDPKRTGDGVLLGYPIISEPVELTPERIKALSATLADPGTYSFDSAKGCAFMPGVAMRTSAKLKDGKATEVVILLCFSCDELAIYVGGKQVGGEDTGNARGFLVTLVKRLFPDDNEIQGLK